MSHIPSPRTLDLLIRNVHLCQEHSSELGRLYDVGCADGMVVKARLVTQKQRDILLGFGTEHFDPDLDEDGMQWNSTTTVIDAGGRGMLIPGLCHAHIHLDKCFLLDRCTLETGDFAEALAVTTAAKAMFGTNQDDLMERGRRLILESVASGVTAMRAHVEIDSTVGMTCLEVGLRLKDEMKDKCEVQIAAFAQDPLFQMSGKPTANLAYLVDASQTDGVEAIGSAPYVEPNRNAAKQNIEYLFDLACRRGLHLDFHLDYNLDRRTEPLIWDVLSELKSRIKQGQWKPTQQLCIGHATRLTLWGPEEWHRYVQTVMDLPVTLVGLPQSDMYMMGRDMSSPPRSTLNVCQLEREHMIKAAMAVNNVSNAFTPQGSADPLGLCPLAVALLQAATDRDCRRLLEAVTINAREAIGLQSHRATNGAQGEVYRRLRLFPVVGRRADFVLLHDNREIQSAVCTPCYDRTTIMGGKVVCRRQSNVTFLS
ncbi:hypothetical protein BC835DRAFT_1503464 [Cytidiella melzeri]|nr:hypothetical protein BC835DRAFT_1503464 [Cytidiella melzeri]